MSSQIIKSLGSVDRAFSGLSEPEIRLAVRLVELAGDSGAVRIDEVLKAFQSVMAGRTRLDDEFPLFIKIFLQLYGGTDDNNTSQVVAKDNHSANHQSG